MPFQVKPGQEYVHPRWLDDDRSPLRVRITRVAEGVAYYRGVYADGSTGACYFVPISVASQWPRCIRPV